MGVALVTGGARRIGAAIVQELHESGMNVIVHCNTSAGAAAALCDALNTARADSAHVLQADLTDTHACARLVDDVVAYWGRLDALINNASSFYPTPVGTITESHWDDIVGTNLKAPLFLSQAAAPHLRTTHGCIVNLVDVHAQRPMKRHPLYSTAKAGLAMLTRALARELGPEVRVNGIAPGAILWPEDGLNKRVKAHIIEDTALKRTGEPDDVADMVRFLVLEAGYVTGQVIAVDGGRSIGW